MINLITGLPGSGKTLYTLKTVKDYVDRENKALLDQAKPPRPVYYHGIPELTIPGWELMESPEDWINLPSHSIIVIDECQSTFRPRAASVKPPPYIAEFETHRHKGLDFFLMTQHPMLVDGNIRRLAGKHYHVVRFYGFQKSTIHEFQQVRDNVDKNLKNSISTHFIYPKEVFTWYKSADAHTIKKRIPMRMIMLVVLPFVLLYVGYLAFGAINNMLNKPNDFAEEKNGLLPGAKSQDSSPQGTSYPEAVKMSYLEARTPALPDFPHTAPIYEELTKPVRAPYPAACISAKSYGCKCFTDKGTKLMVSANVCQQIVQNGYYVDWQEQGADSQNQDGGSPHVDSAPPSAQVADSRQVTMNMQ